MAQGDDVFSVLPGTLAQDELERRLGETDAVVVIKLGRNLPKVRRALERTGRLARAVYIERGTMTGERAIPLAAKADDCAPYFAMVLVPGWERRP
jgi:precorrin-2/cobalt-factor-2 C20-methyltransferase